MPGPGVAASTTAAIRNSRKRCTSSMKKIVQGLEFLFIEHAACADREARSLVHALREKVVGRGVGGHFNATLAASPVFGSAEKGCADAASAPRFRDKPAFDIADRKAFLAAVGG